MTISFFSYGNQVRSIYECNVEERSFVITCLVYHEYVSHDVGVSH